MGIHAAPLRRFLFGNTALFCCAAACLAGNLQIEIVRGGGANNYSGNGQRNPPPRVRVLDEKGTAVAGAVVIFTAPSAGPSVDFAGTGRVAHALTDESGDAGAPSLRPTGGVGPLAIEILAEKDGETANALLYQMNLGAMPDSDRDLEIVAIPDVNADTKNTHRPQLRVRVVGTDQRPVAGASVLFQLRAWNAGKLEELKRVSRISGSDGMAEFGVDMNIGKTETEFVVRAEAGGLVATRFFSLKPR
jgi:hypothetical protein